jgi:imidazolonepropionase-like amidohydrolase
MSESASRPADADPRAAWSREPAPRTIVHCGRLLDGTGRAPAPATLVLARGRVEQVLPPGATPESGEADLVLDGSRHTVVPGLMDLHVHLQHGVLDPREPHLDFGMLLSTAQLLTLWTAHNARLMLEAGFTTARDMSGYKSPRNLEALAVRDAAAIGLVQGPRLFVAGWAGQTAGHGDMGLPRTWPRDPELVADSPWEFRRLVRLLVRDGVDWIKTSTSGGAGGHGEALWWRNHTDEELQALVDEAHSSGHRVACHAHTADGIKRALRAGVDTIEHGVYLDEEGIELLLRHDATLVPTLLIRSEHAVAPHRRAGSDRAKIEKFEALARAGAASLYPAYKAGVRIALGTDTGRTLREFFGRNGYELELMVKVGMTPMDALLAATRNAGIALGERDRLGTLEPGKAADLLLVDGDPLAQISILADRSRIHLVVVDGRIAVNRGVPVAPGARGRATPARGGSRP